MPIPLTRERDKIRRPFGDIPAVASSWRRMLMEKIYLIPKEEDMTKQVNKLTDEMECIANNIETYSEMLKDMFTSKNSDK